MEIIGNQSYSNHLPLALKEHLMEARKMGLLYNRFRWLNLHFVVSISQDFFKLQRPVNFTVKFTRENSEPKTN